MIKIPYFSSFSFAPAPTLKFWHPLKIFLRPPLLVGGAAKIVPVQVPDRYRNEWTGTGPEKSFRSAALVVRGDYITKKSSLGFRAMLKFRLDVEDVFI